MLHDTRLDALADLLIHHSLALKKGEIFQINAAISARPLVVALYRVAAQSGVFPVIRWQDRGINRMAYDFILPDVPESGWFLAVSNRWEQYRWRDIAANLTIRAEENDQEYAAIPRERLQMAAKAGEELRRIIIDERRWVLFNWPTSAQARKAGMSAAEFFDFVLEVSLIDYKTLYQSEQALAARMEAADRVRITAPDTDLAFSIRGMPAVCCYGRRNVPDGEVYTAPVRDSLNGTITYNVPTAQWGRTYRKIRLVFQEGRIVSASGDGDGDELNRIFDSDEGARYVGEFSFGVNPLITRPTGSILFDEKMTGSLHLTPGNAYAKADNGNKSMIHWDLILDQRFASGGGDVWFDDRLIRRDGLFLPEDLQGLNP